MESLHRGCVNTVEFNETGSMLVSGSDDSKILVPDFFAMSSSFHFDANKHTISLFAREYMHTHIYTCLYNMFEIHSIHQIQTYIRAFMHIYVHTNMHTCMHTYIYTAIVNIWRNEDAKLLGSVGTGMF